MDLMQHCTCKHFLPLSLSLSLSLLSHTQKALLSGEVTEAEISQLGEEAEEWYNTWNIQQVCAIYT